MLKKCDFCEGVAFAPGLNRREGKERKRERKFEKKEKEEPQHEQLFLHGIPLSFCAVDSITSFTFPDGPKMGSGVYSKVHTLCVAICGSIHSAVACKAFHSRSVPYL